MLIFVGSYSPEGIQKPPGPLTRLNGTQWWLRFIDTVKVVPGSEITILFNINPDGQTGTISGSGGCNNYSGEIVSAFRLDKVSASKALCETPEGVMEQESAYLNALQNANGVFLEGEQLRITTNQETLFYAKTSPAPSQPTPTPTPGPLVAVVNAPRDANPGQLIKYNAELSTPSNEITSYSL